MLLTGISQVLRTQANHPLSVTRVPEGESLPTEQAQMVRQLRVRMDLLRATLNGLANFSAGASGGQNTATAPPRDVTTAPAPKPAA